MRTKIAACLLVYVAVYPLTGLTDETRYEFDGHTKLRVQGQAFPRNSIFHDVAGDSTWDADGLLRLKFSADRDAWTFNTDYQLIAQYGDSVEFTRDPLSSLPLGGQRIPNDDRRFLDLTHTSNDSGTFASTHRLDRLWLGYSSANTVVRVGRQALTWGNGLFFSPLDIVNSFDPATIDTEYKSGDDMLYAQYLTRSGDDVQAAYVVRRNPASGDVDSDQSTSAVKYHRISGDNEIDILIAHSYSMATIGIGGNRSMGGAVWRADLVVTDAEDWTAELVTNLSYSWVWREKNMSGAIEYYFNGFGQDKNSYDLLSLAQNPELLARLGRGQTFSIGRNYIAAGLTIELSPLWLITPNLFANLDDGSALLQFVTQHNMGDNLTFLAALNLPIGPDGSEYGGIGAIPVEKFVSSSGGLFAQIAWYF
jgi:hypothetical protein